MSSSSWAAVSHGCGITAVEVQVRSEINESGMSNTEILREFLLETHENLTLLDSDLLTLEKNPADKSTLAQVFRTMHSVKGTAGFLGLMKLQSVAHSAESLLSRLRSGELSFNPAIATAMLRVVDAIREMLASIENSGEEGSGDYAELTAQVDRLREEGNAEAAVQPVVEQLVNSSPTMFDSVVHDVSESRSGSVADSSIRVDVGLLDKLMTLVGELVLARNQILRYSDAHEDDQFLGAVQRLNLLTSDLQASVMKTRMQPIGNVLNKFPRVVRDLALACGKKVRFEMDGQETELDKTLIEAIRDPLTHIVRNSIDHGIELPAVRKSRGKPEEGCLRMDAFHEGGKVLIEISDDGDGIDIGRIREKAINAKLVPPEELARMSPQELMRLIFLPGFSTADQVTQFSGRGVGMDVVRTNIEKIGGTVDIESTPGVGTTIRTKIPLTLAIIPALIISSGDERYAIPQVSLLELVRLDPEQTHRGVERMHGAPVYRLRGSLLPLVFLGEQLELETVRTSERELNIIVLQADGRPFGLVVDSISDTEEIVVKPLQKQLKGTSVFAGATIMGDGRVALVLDVHGLAERAKVLSSTKSQAIRENEISPPLPAIVAEPLLLFASSSGGQMAIPLALVARLEEIPHSALEFVGSQLVTQYRDEILTLIDISVALEQLSGGDSLPRSTACGHRLEAGELDPIPVIVYSQGEQRVGLIVGRIIDIVYEHIATRARSNRPGILFNAIVQQKVTEFVDIAALVGDATSNLNQVTA